MTKVLSSEFNAFPVFIPPELREKSYRGARHVSPFFLAPNTTLSCVTMPTGFCKQHLWPLFHYLLPLMPKSAGRFDPDLWSAYVKANQVRQR